VVVRIPFNVLGDFVYHCHILGHEDSGMMAKISVVPGRSSRK
jgi:FtsP/CotA-like multicopper oxidase with cupredoxin domain